MNVADMAPRLLGHAGVLYADRLGPARVIAPVRIVNNDGVHKLPRQCDLHIVLIMSRFDPGSSPGRADPRQTVRPGGR